MLLGKAACFLLMAVLAAVCLDHSVSGTGCREEDKKEILTNCALSIKNGKVTPPAPIVGGVCCQAVRAALAKDSNMMDCIVRNLTDEEKKMHSPVKMMELVGQCKHPASMQAMV